MTDNSGLKDIWECEKVLRMSNNNNIEKSIWAKHNKVSKWLYVTIYELNDGNYEDGMKFLMQIKMSLVKVVEALHRVMPLSGNKCINWKNFIPEIVLKI